MFQQIIQSTDYRKPLQPQVTLVQLYSQVQSIHIIKYLQKKKPSDTKNNGKQSALRTARLMLTRISAIVLLK